MGARRTPGSIGDGRMVCLLMLLWRCLNLGYFARSDDTAHCAKFEAFAVLERGSERCNNRKNSLNVAVLHFSLSLSVLGTKALSDLQKLPEYNAEMWHF